MKIVLFGSTGTLGKYVKIHLLQQGFKMHCVNRCDFNVETEDWKNLWDLLDTIVLDGDILINCVGVLPHPQHLNPRKFIAVNTLFPQELSKWARHYEQIFIHVDSAGVFSGEIGGYDENRKHDATDIYGITRSAGEDKTMCILRAGVLGEKVKFKQNLLEWMLEHSGEEIQGDANLIWNGLTCLQIAKVIEHMLKNGILWKGVRHLYSPISTTNYALCKWINEKYDLDIKIVKPSRFVKKDMTLTSVYELPCVIPTIQQQIQEQYEFYQKYREQLIAK